MAFTDAPVVRKIADKLIKEFHSHLHGARIEYAFTDKTPRTKGKDQWGKVQKISGLAAHLATPLADGDAEDFFAMVISAEIWGRLGPPQQIALVDHELMHLGYDDENDCIALKGHDLEEFNDIVDRHGFWRTDVEVFAGTVKEQLKLPGVEAHGLKKAETSSSDGTPVICIDTDKPCKQCKQGGATGNGLCLDCISKKMANGDYGDTIKRVVVDGNAAKRIMRAIDEITK